MTDLRVPCAQELGEIADLVTSTLLDVHSVPIPKPVTPLTDPLWIGCISITGPALLAVTIACTRNFVLRATTAMLAEDTEEAARDVLGELTNVIGGNIKSLLSSPSAVCHLALPVVAIGELDLPASTLLREQWCSCEGDPFVVSLWQSEKPA